MAIQNINFMGREGCIEPVAKKTAETAGKFFNGRSPMGSAKVENQVTETVRKADVASYVNSRQNIVETATKEAKIEADKLAEAYKAAHGIV